jgi:2-hydroxycyclohexanecarboxyl-CoA dehydrogenase
MRGLTNKIAVITGAAGGIGGAVSRRLSEEGVHVAMLDINPKPTDLPNAKIFKCDITNHEMVQNVIADIEANFGAIDILINNAGWDVFRPFLKTTPEEWQKLIAINLTGALNMHHAVLPYMVKRRSGRIVNIASDAARVGSSGEAVYAACKAGLLGLTKTLAREHAHHGITLNVVCPGPTDTALFAEYREGASNPEKLDEAFKRAIPMGRIGQPQDLTGAISFLASDDAAYITGQVISVSGGLTMAG